MTKVLLVKSRDVIRSAILDFTISLESQKPTEINAKQTEKLIDCKIY